jgi:uncharacterized protein
VEVDCPPAEQPVLDPLPIEQIANRAERGELGILEHTISFAWPWASPTAAGVRALRSWRQAFPLRPRCALARRGRSFLRHERRSRMTAIKDAAAEFLSHRRVAVTGVSRSRDHGSNAVYTRLRDRGYEVFAVNPNADEVEGDPAYHSLSDIPGGIEAVVIGTRPEIAEETMRECAELEIKHVWMHRGPGAGSVSERATAYGRQHGIAVIDGGCPCMFDPTADLGHKAMRVVFTLNGNVPKQV